MIKIKFECWWCNAYHINNRIIRQYVNQDDLNKYEFVNENQDYTIILGLTDWESITTPKENTFYISQEPLWCPREPKNTIDKYCSKILIADKRVYSNNEEYIETLLPMLYAGHGESDNRSEWDWSYSMKDKTYDKSKIMSMIVTNNCCIHYPYDDSLSKVIYPDRTNLAHTLSRECDWIDIYGKHWQPNDKNIKGEIWNKHVGLDEYQFSIACENSIQKNYISEKFWDVIITDCIPIYIGCSNIDEHIPSDSYIYLNNLDEQSIINKLIDIKTNSQDYYNHYIKGVKELKNEYFTNPKYSIWERIKQLINNN